MVHIPVLNEEVVKYLEPRPGENFIDGTCGGAGHTVSILKRVGEEGKVLCLDLDRNALENARKKIGELEQDLLSRLILAEGNFGDLDKIARENNFSPVNGVLIDIGLSSDQLEESGRGFSFQKDEPLDMRFSVEQDLIARDIVNGWDQDEIERILKEYGEERFAGYIARHIIQQRKIKPIERTSELVQAIALAVPKKFQHARIHFATRTFQALRIAVNDELGNLERFLPRAFDILSPGGRIAVISFHSLEDRIVKNFFRNKKQEGLLEILTKKPVVATDQEMAENPRSRSAKLRAARKI